MFPVASRQGDKRSPNVARGDPYRDNRFEREALFDARVAVDANLKLKSVAENNVEG